MKAKATAGQMPMFTQEQTGDLRPLVHVLYDAADLALGCFSNRRATEAEKSTAIKELKNALYLARAVQESWHGGRKTKPMVNMMRTWLVDHTRLLNLLAQATKEKL
jgi:hypothetical protein